VHLVRNSEAPGGIGEPARRLRPPRWATRSTQPRASCPFSRDLRSWRNEWRRWTATTPHGSGPPAIGNQLGRRKCPGAAGRVVRRLQPPAAASDTRHATTRRRTGHATPVPPNA